jgi:hypothetical protein
MTVQNWKKLGRIFTVDKISEDLYSHAAVPFVGEINNDGITEIFFSARNNKNQSVLTKILFDLKNLKVIKEATQPLLYPTEVGKFDSDGVMGCDIYTVGNKKLLTYIGWNLGLNIPFRNAIGVAEMKGNEVVKLYDGPILDRSVHDPCFVASNCVIKKGETYLMYYLSCIRWTQTMEGLMHHYHIKIAESIDGLTWKSTGKVAIDFASENEYAISVPRVIYEDNTYKMWFSYRGSAKTETYRVGYAESQNAYNWIRKDMLVNLDVSEAGWDSDMICYPYIFDFEKKRFMLYNGNGYGMSGLGLAILEK